ncbi:hypothetical protein AB3X91_15995 [Paraburkholderia sp. BR14263]|uniref:hypothetical protein n=1 Tax=unclassified Paraburkholderia TaxID=2615204 RepID=UPI0034CE90EA
MPRQDIYRTHCIACGPGFTDANVYSDAGWIETQTSGLCEHCFDTVAELLAFPKDGVGHDESSDGGTGG